MGAVEAPQQDVSLTGYRKLAEFLGRHRGRYLCRLGLQHAGIGVDFHRFRNLANLQHHVLRNRLAHAHSNAILPVCPEPGLLDRQAIHGRRQLVENVLPGFARDSFAEGICGGIGDYYSRTCDDSTGRIGNEAGDGTTDIPFPPAALCGLRPGTAEGPPAEGPSVCVHVMRGDPVGDEP